ncbi:uncharacterized protein LOC117213042 [Bombus bifarius]|uniref:Uncharacterized protein LOC117213042 n=1 Tax=Bombus bifarius TaxID=103933 RepID=A0A6P8N0F9_9HYME|nr:uncharacterized protein LOC117213042 [Bombus bifarius]
MKRVVGITGIMGYLLISYIVVVTLTVKQCKSEITKSPSHLDTNRTTSTGPVIVNRDEDDEIFIPYQGERFSIFDWALFRTMSKKYSGNMLLSPISLKIVLVLLYEGAQDETAHELATAMQLPANENVIRKRFSTILQSLQTNPPAYILNIGTRIYIDSNILIRQKYEATVKAYYDTDVISANLSDAQPLVQAINDWVSNITDANIDQMIKDENNVKNSLMLIMNTLFFKGTWRHKYFSPENTRTGKFHTIDNRTIDVPFMHTFGRFYYANSPELDAKILRIPYDGRKFALYLLLPRNRTLDGIEHLINEVTPFVLTRYVWQMQNLPIAVSIPKFKYQFSSHMEPVLREVGIRNIFDDTATLTGIAQTRRISSNLKVSDILQKTGIEVNENGTTAYVATEIDIGNKIGEEIFHADHPFLFYIEDESTGTIIYIGRMMNPLDTTGSTASGEQYLSQSPPKLNAGISNADSISQAGLNAEDRNNLFNMYFPQALSKKYTDGNLVSSPASVKTILTMLMEGANGNTKSEIISVLRLPPEGKSRRGELAQRILASLNRNENGTEIALTTRLWIHENLRVSNNYKNILRSRYQGDIESVNFMESQSTARHINEWVRRVTHNTISSALLLNDLPPDTRLILTSVIYFKGLWLKSFDKANTKLQCFYIPNGECRNTYFMKHGSIYRYAYIPSIEAYVLEIPYSDGKTSMLTLMPRSRENDPYLRILSDDLITVPVSAILANLKKQDITIHLPKFNIENNLNLVPTLRHLGIENIFQPNTNLSKMISDSSIHVTSILQNVKLEIDEEGTLAATDTEIGYELLSSWGNDVKMDRPFLFMIIDTVLNMTLFSGRFIEPLK